MPQPSAGLLVGAARPGRCAPLLPQRPALGPACARRRAARSPSKPFRKPGLRAFEGLVKIPQVDTEEAATRYTLANPGSHDRYCFQMSSPIL